MGQSMSQKEKPGSHVSCCHGNIAYAVMFCTYSMHMAQTYNVTMTDADMQSCDIKRSHACADIQWSMQQV